MKIRKMTLAALLAALTAICAWLSVPVLDIAFTMQSFAILLTLGVLGGKWGSISIGIYLLLGAVGLPVFTGFQGGLGTLLGVTGGYIWGFLLGGVLYRILEKLGRAIAMAGCLVMCYLCGSLWFLIYGGSGAGLWAILLKCVVPYLVPDLFKLYLAYSLSGRVRRYLPR